MGILALITFAAWIASVVIIFSGALMEKSRKNKEALCRRISDIEIDFQRELSLIKKEKKKMNLKTAINNHGMSVKLTFKEWPKGKYFVPEKLLGSGDYVGTLYGCPEQDGKPTSVIKKADGAQKWEKVQTKTVYLSPALVKDEDDVYHVTRKLYRSEQEAKEAFEDNVLEDGDEVFVKLLTDRQLSVTEYV